MTGKLFVIGLGPGNEDQVTSQAMHAVVDARYFYGYKPYIDRLTFDCAPDQVAVASDNREELARAREALEKAAGGESVAIVSGGDPGVFAMAAAVCEAIEHGPAEWRDIDLEIVPGVTAMLAVAARIGAPLGHDFCAISLSDNLKPWESSSFACGSRRGRLRHRPLQSDQQGAAWQLGRAFEAVSAILPPETPVVFGRAAGRPDEHIEVHALRDARPDMADMATCVIIGSPETRIIERGEKPALVYATRFARRSRA
jgi:precorrin-3B C17-methyltransferase